jgi:hypothetical protein
LKKFPFLENPSTIDGKKVLNKTHQHVLEIQVANIFSHVKNNSTDSELIERLKKYNVKPDEQDLNAGLSEINSLIRKSRQLGEMKFAAFVSTVDLEKRFDDESLKLIQGIVLFAAAELNSNEDCRDSILLGLRAIRLMIERSTKKLYEKLARFDTSLDMIVAHLKEEQTRCDDESLTRNLDSIRLLLEHYLGKFPFKKGDGGTDVTPHRFENKVVEKAPTIAFEPGDPKVQQYMSVTIDQVGDSSDKAERVADQIPADFYASVELVSPRNVRKSLALSHFQARNVANQITKRNKLLISDVSNITRYEIKRFLRETDKNLRANGTVTDLFALLVLFTGKSVEWLATMPNGSNPDATRFWRVNEQGLVQIVKSIVLPKHEMPSKLIAAKIPSQSSIVLTLPEYISGIFVRYFRQNISVEDTKQDIQQRLSVINKKYNCHLTITRLMNYLGYILKRQGIDGAEIALLVMDDKILHPGNYYYQLPSERLIKHYKKFTSTLLGFIGIKEEHIHLEADNSLIGSNLQLDKMLVKRLFSSLLSAINATRKGYQNIERFHNLYVIYSLELLFLSTGHRPVRHPFESLDIFDLDNKTIFISDKESRSDLSARMLVLPDIAIGQMTQYLSHIRAMKQHYSNYNPALRKQLEEIENGKAPTFFFICGEKIEHVVPSNLERELKEIMPFKLNWHRHFLRSYLRYKNLTGDWVDAWMGHSNLGDEGFARFSSLSMKNLEKVAQELNSLIQTELCVSQLVGKD